MTPASGGLPPPIRRAIAPDPRTCAEIVADDERALRRGTPEVRVAVVADAALSYGVGVRGRPSYLERGAAAGLALVRRTSGGTGVLHAPGDLVWSLVLPRNDPRVGRDFSRAYARLGHGLVRFLKLRAVAARWRPAPGLVPDCCVLSDRGETLAIGDGVLAGAAQHLSARALLHQGMLPLAIDRDLAAGVFSISDLGTLRRLIGLRDLGIGGTPLDLAAQVGESLAEGLALAAP